MSFSSSAFETYREYINARGETRRGTVLAREKRYLTTKLKDTLSYFTVTFDDSISQEVAIINSDNLNEKQIISLPGEDIRLGSIVTWMDNHWLVSEKDANNEVYTKCIMLQCNYLLKWVDDDNIIRQEWCVVEDGTKYMTGELEDRDFITTRGDSRIAITITRNKHTAKLGRTNRFLVDDTGSDHMMAFALTKPLKVGHFYDSSNGVYKFVLQEVDYTDNDNFELGIADYYKHFDEDGNVLSDTSTSEESSETSSATSSTTSSTAATATITTKKGWL